MMFPMIEMAGKHHKCISKVLYIYNIQNPLNDFKIHTKLQTKLNYVKFVQKKDINHLKKNQFSQGKS